MIAGPVGVRVAEVAGHNRAVDCRDNLGQEDCRRLPGQDVAATDPTLRTDQASALQGQEDLLEIGLRKARLVGDLAHRPRVLAVAVEGEGQQGAAGVVAPRRDLHVGRS